MLFLPQEVCAAGQRRCAYLFPRLREARCKRRGVPRIGTRRRQASRRAAGGNGARRNDANKFLLFDVGSRNHFTKKSNLAKFYEKTSDLATSP